MAPTVFMKIRRTALAMVQALLIMGLAAAYLGAAIGLTGYISARTVSLIALCGAGVAFFATLAYFAVAESTLRRRDMLKQPRV